MGYEVIKLELIEWLATLEDEETLGYLKIVKNANVSQEEGANDWPYEQKSGIKRGLKDVDEGRVTRHDIVKQKYGLK